MRQRTGFMVGVFANLLEFALCAFGGQGADVRAELEKDYPVKVVVNASAPDRAGKQQIQVALTIEDPWELYANPVGVPGMEHVQTTLQIVSTKPLRQHTVKYSEGLLIKSQVVGNYSVYRKKAVFRAEVQRADGDNGPLEVQLRLMPLNYVKEFFYNYRPRLIRIRIP